MINKNKIIIFLLLFAAVPILVWSQQDARSLYEEGRTLQINHEYFKAIEKYKLSIQQNEHYFEPLLGLSESFFFLGEYDESLRWVNRAEIYNRNQTSLKILKARIFIIQGKFEEGEAIFSEVLANEPNNIEANFGLAELQVAEGKIRQGARLFKSILKMDPDNRKALLILTLVYDSMNDFEQSEQYIRQALHYHYENIQTQLTAAKHYFRMEKYDLAESHGKTANMLDKNNPEVVRLLGNLYLETEQYDNAVGFLEKSISYNREDSLIWYVLGLAYSRIGNQENSLQSLNRSIILQPDDEIPRIFLEQLLSLQIDEESTLRNEISAYHLERGESFEDKNLYVRALSEYRRAMKVNPFFPEVRLSYARIYKKMGFPGKYLSELLVLKDMNYLPTDVEDEIDIQKSILEESISNLWGIQQFSKETRKYNYVISLFIPEKNISLIHYSADTILLDFLKDVLLHNENISINISGRMNDFAEAYSRARQSESDYFIIFQPSENERFFSLHADLFSSHTGGKIKTYYVRRTGNDKVMNAVQKIAEEIHADFVPRGSLINRDFDKGLINLGTMENVQIDDTFLIVKKGDVKNNIEDFGFTFPEESILGTITITGTDEQVSEGIIKKSGFFDMINIGDTILPVKKDDDQKPAEETTFQPVSGRLYEDILSIQ